MLQVTFHAVTILDLRAQLEIHLADLNTHISIPQVNALPRETPPIAKTPAEIKAEWAAQQPAPTDMFETTQATPAAEPEKRKRRTKAEIEAEKNKLAEGTTVKTHEPELVEDAVVISAKNVTGAPTKEDVHEALQMVNATEGLGITKSRAILTEFGAIRISAIKETDYPKFIKTCQDAVSQIAMS